ncbi:mechanosensitive ion channel family protein [Rhizobium sp. BK251]|uniref:mechanosensitive ion channel family protein n=1 Tax=Rhizobium sp. BK251 TaxID=2512125 RepID=UPI001053DC1C|nr:mechanosensitive ion channel family protein [Rhizobium sp. BK251]TCL75555.1 small-conductance mechanosensitive channel [Rhizobium sp. BK251]
MSAGFAMLRFFSRLRRCLCLLAPVMLLLAVWPAPVLAQTAPATNAKVDEFVKLLADPEVRDWLQAQYKTASPPAPENAAPSADGSAVSLFASTLRRHLQSMIAAAPTLPTQAMRASDIIAVEFEERGSFEILGLIAGFILVGLGLDWVAYRMTGSFRHWLNSQSWSSPHGRARALLGRVAYAAIMLLLFTLGSAGLFLSFEWPPLLREVVIAYLIAAVITRGSLMLGRALLIPPSVPLTHAQEFRVLPMSDESAAHWYRWIAINVAWFAVVGATFTLLPTFGFDVDARRLLSLPVGFVQLVLVELAIWLRPAPAQNGTEHFNGPKVWLLSAYFVVLWLLWLIAPLVFRFAVAAFLLPAIIIISHRAVYFLLRAPEPPSTEKPVTPVLLAVIDRGIRVALIVGVVALVAHLSGVDTSMMAASETMAARLLRGGVKALVILLAADFGWCLIKALIARKLTEGTETHVGDVEEGHSQVSAHHARLRTLLPIFQNMLFAVILVIAILMVLSSLGIEIGPLIAGAGVVGVAIGFGAQTLVKDIISGVFFLLDDAFRVGEYIVSGSYKGTVEAFSLRSVKLRHHRGPLFTVPFGELGAVQNLSRDWVIDKFSIKVDYKTDIDQARKLVKKIGQDLAADPEFAADIIEPLKMQGVENFGDYGIELRVKMKTKPGGQFVLRRKALVAIKRAFEENGIEIPYPTVHVREGENPMAAAARLMSVPKDLPREAG